MLNKNGTGEVLFGINDDGKVFGINIGKKTKADVVHEIQNNLKPIPSILNINEIELETKKIIVVKAQGTDTPYSAYGRYYLRLNDADIKMSSSELQNYFEKKKDNYLDWEKQETDYTVDDIDEDLLIECVRKANDKGRMNYVYRNANEALSKFGLITNNNKLNNAGLLLFGNNKPMKIKEAAFPTDSRTDFGEIKEFRGNIFECINEAMIYIQNHINFKARIEGIQRVEIPEIPLKALREIIINSFAHRSYARIEDSNSYIVFKSSVKIYNAGSIYKNIDPEQFANGKVGSKIRNILISQVLFYCGFIDAFGTGFDRTFTLCDKENVDYSYYNDEFGFTFIFKRNKEFLENIHYEDEKQNKVKPNKMDVTIINEITKNKYVTISQLSTKLKKSEITIYRHLENLMGHNIIKRVGSRKSGFWEICNN